MKKNIHPQYEKVTITCGGCGNVIVTRSTRCEDFAIEVCSNCHPLYTGRQKFVDSAGRVDRFQGRYKSWDSTGALKAGAEKRGQETEEEREKRRRKKEREKVRARAKQAESPKKRPEKTPADGGAPSADEKESAGKE